ncbi:helicase [Pseudomonas aeruginosa]|nr:helicase [Pseudomonas aeruginosa]
MSFIRSCISRSVFLLGAGVAVAAQAEVRIDGPIEYGVFESRYQDFQPGERVLTRSEQNIQQTTEVPAKLGTKFGMRYQLSGKQEGDTPLTLLYLTPGVVTPDGQRHDKFEVVQKLVPGRADRCHGLRIHRAARSGEGRMAVDGVPGRSPAGVEILRRALSASHAKRWFSCVAWITRGRHSLYRARVACVRQGE